MSEYLGSRISLISKSDIRYVGILHEINSEESTVSLENVKSFGTEGRRKKAEEEIAPSDQVYDYIVFRGSDVKDLRIEQQPPVKENKPPAMPDDPAILGARPRPDHQAPNAQPTMPAPGFAPPYNGFYGPPAGGSWGRGGGPAPGLGPTFPGMPYPYPPGWHPGQGFPPGPAGPVPWPGYPFPPGQPVPGAPGPGQNRSSQATPNPTAIQDPKPIAIGAGVEKQMGVAPGGQHVLAEMKSLTQPAPTPPVDSKPSLEEVKATAASLGVNGQVQKPGDLNKAAPTGPKGNRVMPALPIQAPIPKALLKQAAEKTANQTTRPIMPPTDAIIHDATQAAKAAVAIAMAKLDVSSGNAEASSASGGNSMATLVKNVHDLRVTSARSSGMVGRGRGRGGRPAQGRVPVPNEDFDFASSNAKFNKEDVVKEAIAGSPLTESASDSAVEALDAITGDDVAPAYSKTHSFFDNISSEAKDRADSSGQKPGGREWRGEEQRKNMETFGQSSVDGGYRNNYRARGRGRGGMRGRGYGRGSRGGQQPREAQPAATNQ